MMEKDKRSPITGGRIELRSEDSVVSYRGREIEYKKYFYHCVDTGMGFVDEELERMNLGNIFETYGRQAKE